MSRESKIIHITTGFLNTVDDEIAGGPATGTGEAQYQGQLGGWVEFDATEAAKHSDTAIGTLFAGRYRYIRTKTASTITPARGLIAFWDVATAGLTDSVVTPDLPTGTSLIAGIYLSVITKTAGNHGFIQTMGVANVQGVASFAETPAVGDLVIASTGAKMDNLAGAVDIDPLEVQAIIGVAEEVPADGTITRVVLNIPQMP